MTHLGATAATVRAAIKRTFSAPDWAVAFEVAQSTGFGANRHLDAIAMHTWPSRGLEIRGIEVKVSKYDWRRELANPAKAEEIARFCDTFYVAAPPGCVEIEEVPVAWGYLELGEDGFLKIIKRAEKTEAAPVTKAFLAAMMRASCRADNDTLDAMIKAREAQLNETFQQRVDAAAKVRTERAATGAEEWERLVEIVGGPDKARLFYADDDLLRAIRLVYNSRANCGWQGIPALIQHIERAGAELRERASAAGFEIEAPELPKRRRKAA
jgi:hypothetical protein